MKKISTLLIVGIITSVSLPAMSVNHKEGKEIYINRATTSLETLDQEDKKFSEEKKENIVAGLFGLFNAIF